MLILDSQIFMEQVLMASEAQDSKVRAKRRENHRKKDVLQTIEKKKKMQITCHRLTVKVNKEATLEVVQVLNIKIRCQCQSSNNSSNNTCLNSSIPQISTHLLKDNKIKILDKTVFHLVIMALEISKLHRFTSSLKSNNLLLKFLLIN
tara:strand:- start:212 stop:655 length:444 start_codon:yes stop_codon:yes gene_type:complete